ncbi:MULTISPECIES: type II secretion system protein [unclassified Microbacterium]|nr:MULTISPECIES: type II secretion system protein [unclassified Microbacterium]MBT2484833.1 type II secretion system protein [Microbacterium sp. ISL-108]RKN67703.1 type II secretion system protein [Microbacterium sp. CGR2]
MTLIGVLLVALIVGALATLIIITLVGADRKLRRARRESETEK